MLKRLRPYTRYLRPVRWQFVGALLAGLIYGLASGAGIPIIIKEVLPRIWVEGAQTVPFTDLLMAGYPFLLLASRMEVGQRPS